MKMNKKNKMKYSFVIIILILLAQVSLAQAQQSKNDSLTISDLYIDLNTPEITAFSILNIGSEEIETAGSIKEFITTIDNYIDDKGNLKPGLALEWAPFQTYFSAKGNTWDPDKKYAARNFAVSIATSTSDSTNLKLGWGAKWNIIDKTNILTNKKFNDQADTIFKNTLEEFYQYQGNIINELAYEINVEGLIKLSDAYNDKSSKTTLRRCIGKVITSDNENFTTLKNNLITNDIIIDRISVQNYLKTQFIDTLNQEIDTNYISDDELFEYAIDYISKKNTAIFFERQSKPSFTALYEPRLEKLKKAYQDSLWNKLAVQFSGGAGYLSDSGFVDDFSPFNYSYSGSVAFPFNIFCFSKFEDWKRIKDKKKLKNFLRAFKPASDFLDSKSRLVGMVRWQDFINHPDGNYNRLTLGGRLLFGGAKTRFSVEACYYSYYYATDNQKNEAWRYAVGIEYRAFEDFWLEIGVGGATASDITELKAYPQFAIRRSLHTEKRKF